MNLNKNSFIVGKYVGYIKYDVFVFHNLKGPALGSFVFMLNKLCQTYHIHGEQISSKEEYDLKVELLENNLEIFE